MFIGDIQNRILLKNELHHRYLPANHQNFKNIYFLKTSGGLFWISQVSYLFGIKTSAKWLKLVCFFCFVKYKTWYRGNNLFTTFSRWRKWNTECSYWYLRLLFRSKILLNTKWNFPLRISSVKVIKNPQFPADLVTFTEEILNGKLHFLSSESFSLIFPYFLSLFTICRLYFFKIKKQKKISHSDKFKEVMMVLLALCVCQ